MAPSAMLQLAAELRERAAVVTDPERADLLFLAEEYEASARTGGTDKVRGFSVTLPK